jgi:hypothetical protein
MRHHNTFNPGDQVMTRSGKIGYALVYNALFLLMVPVMRLVARNSGLDDLLLGALGTCMFAVGLMLVNRGNKGSRAGWQMLWREPLRLWRDRLARGLIAGSMIWLNVYFLVTSAPLNPRANSQAWSFFTLLALIALGLAWALVLTSPSDTTQADSREA